MGKYISRQTRYTKTYKNTYGFRERILEYWVLDQVEYFMK